MLINRVRLPGADDAPEPSGTGHRMSDRTTARPDLMRPAAVYATQVPAFYSVAETARMFGMSEMTLYRAIAAGQFPAVRIRGRLIVPAKAIELMVDAALGSGGQVDATDWVPGGVA